MEIMGGLSRLYKQKAGCLENSRGLILLHNPCPIVYLMGVTQPSLGLKDAKFINCRIGPFWRAVWMVIWAVRKRILSFWQEAAMITEYPRPVEEAMRYTFSTLNERQRRVFAASEALKLGHGGIAYIAQLLDCHRRTIERGLNELRHPDSLLPPHRARKKGVAAKAV